MTKTITLKIAIFSAFLFTGVSAQNVYFTGVGRALVTTSNLKDETNPASKKKSSGGYTMFDLGIYAKASEVLRGGVILRTRNEFGGFFGDGAMLQFRQMQLEGLINKKIKYEIGDVYLTHTPYTLWNNENVFGYNKYEANIFSLRRDIVNYENFFVGNAWRMQGFNTNAKLTFEKYAESLGIRVYGGRTRQTDFASIPDRYFFGGRLDLTQSKYLRIAGNLAAMSDIAGTVKKAQVDYDNKVFTTDFDLNAIETDKFKAGINGEIGSSQFALNRASDSTNKKFEDYFYDLGVKATYKPWNFNFGASYRNVGVYFNSPMAQTRRINSPAVSPLSTIGVLNDDKTARPISLFDATSQEYKLYNPGISTTLMNYYIPYDIVEPYGKATPNRQGITITGEIQPENEFFKAGAEVNLLSEIVSEGDNITHGKRKFTKITGGGVFNLHKVLKYEKVIAINAGIRTETSDRGGVNAIKLQSSLIDLGLDIEVFKSLHLLGGVKMFAVKGTEVTPGRNELNQIIGYSSDPYNRNDNVTAFGLRYDYDKAGYFSMQYNMVKVDDKDNPGSNYQLNQLFFVYGLKF